MSTTVKKTYKEVKEHKSKVALERLPNTSFIIYRNKIIKVIDESPLGYTGFDIFSESLFLVKKNKEAIHLPEAVIKLLGCEKSRLRLADSLTETRNNVAKLMGIDERSVFRCYKRHNMFPDDLICEDGKIMNKQVRVLEEPEKNNSKKKLKLNKAPTQKLITDGKKRKA